MEINSNNYSTTKPINPFDLLGDETITQIFNNIKSPDHKTFKSINLTCQRFYQVNNSYKHVSETEALLDTEFHYNPPETLEALKPISPLLVINKIVYFIRENQFHAWKPSTSEEIKVDINGTPRSLSLLENGKIFIENEGPLSFFIDPATLAKQEKYLPSGAAITRSNLNLKGSFAFMTQQTNKLILQDDIEADEFSRRELEVKPFKGDNPFQCTQIHVGNTHLFASYKLDISNFNIHRYSLNEFKHLGKFPALNNVDFISNERFLVIISKLEKISIFALHDFSHLRSIKLNWGSKHYQKLVESNFYFSQGSEFYKFDLEANQLVFKVDRSLYPQLDVYYDLSDDKEFFEDFIALSESANNDKLTDQAFSGKIKNSVKPNFSIDSFAVNKHLIAIASDNNFIDLWDANRGWFVGGLETPNTILQLEWSDNLLVATTILGEVLAWPYEVSKTPINPKKRKHDQVEDATDSSSGIKKKK